MLVVGAGAIGGITAALMQERGLPVAVLGRDRPETLRLRDPGLRIERHGVTTLAPLDVVRRPEELRGDFDFCVLSVKATSLDAVLAQLVRRGGIDTFVSLGNGLVQERVAQIVGEERLIVASVEWGATNLGAGHVRQTSDNPFTIGELDGTIRPRTRALAAALEAVTEVRISTNIRGKLWSKLLLNSALSALSVVGGCDCATALSAPNGARALRLLWREGYELAVRQGVEPEPILGLDPGWAAAEDDTVWASAVASLIRQSGPTIASMLQDLRRGQPTEVDVINGAVVAGASALGAPAPYNSCVVELVHSFERGERQPSTALYQQLVAAS